jgi:hypothetical protein
MHFEDLLGTDTRFSRWIEAQGLKIANPQLDLVVGSLDAVRGFTLYTDSWSGEVEPILGDPGISLTGRGVIEHGDRIAVWDEKGGNSVETSMRISFHSRPDKVTDYAPLMRMPHLDFNSDVFWGLGGSSGGTRWSLRVPLPKAELQRLFNAVESGTAAEVRIQVTIGNMLIKTGKMSGPIHEPTEYFALPDWVVEGKYVDHDTPPFRVRHLPCPTVYVSLQSGTLNSKVIMTREEEEAALDRAWEPEPVSTAQDAALAVMKSARDGLWVIASLLVGLLVVQMRG